MRRAINDLVRLAAAIYSPPGPVAEFGAYYTPEHAAQSNLRPYFPNRRYVGCDIRHGPGVDQIDDAQRMSFQTASIGAVIMLEILEHLPMPVRAVAEARRVLRDDGILIVSVPFTYRLHGYPSDYWRFTASGLHMLLEPFGGRNVVAVGPRLKPAFCFAVASPAPSMEFTRSSERFSAVAESHFRGTRSRGFKSAFKERARDFFGLLLGRAELGLQFHDPSQRSPYEVRPESASMPHE